MCAPSGIFTKANGVSAAEFVAKDLIAQSAVTGACSVTIAAIAAAAGASVALLPAFAVTAAASLLDTVACKLSDLICKQLDLKKTGYAAEAIKIAFRITAIVGAILAISAACPEVALTVGLGVGLYAVASALKAIFALGFEKAPCLNKKDKGAEGPEHSQAL